MATERDKKISTNAKDSVKKNGEAGFTTVCYLLYIGQWHCKVNHLVTSTLKSPIVYSLAGKMRYIATSVLLISHYEDKFVKE